MYTTCFICGKQLSNHYNLRVHMETHQNVQYACSACNHVSRSRDALRKHVSYRHPPALTSDTTTTVSNQQLAQAQQQQQAQAQQPKKQQQQLQQQQQAQSQQQQQLQQQAIQMQQQP